ncbi:MAG TPA: SIS domain-containing protein [Flavitalea sp.]|nr:SIS domain-containing protein [Flavitalea sp.]
MEAYVRDYLAAQKKAQDALPMEQAARLILEFKNAWKADKQIFVFGNGGSAANASHFVTDLGKSASDKLPRPFRCMSLNDNVSWITALGNDYSYQDVFARQLMNFARPGDLVMTLSVSGSSPNLVAAVEWAKKNNVYTIALVGGNRGKLAEIADLVIAVEATHYGRVEDIQMGICHIICYAFAEEKVDMK